MRGARPAGDAALLVEADGVAARLASAIRIVSPLCISI